ncbi:MAG TPA: acyltransferase [Candidatus Poseidoniaceae archaeon]|jgi:acetyltransferase-like isoleucine patch superfamily enzyme|nr:acyltransferase [Candidatus Poseidoniaceae archaeon]
MGLIQLLGEFRIWVMEKGISNKLRRQRFFTKIVKKQVGKFGSDFKVNGMCRLNKSVIIKNNVNLNGMNVQGNGQVIIGNNFHSGKEILLITQNHNWKNAKKIPYDDEYILTKITIEDNVWLGSRVTIVGNTTIGEGSIIQAGSVVVNDIPPLSIAGGHPATVFSKRDEGHYNECKKMNKIY